MFTCKGTAPPKTSSEKDAQVCSFHFRHSVTQMCKNKREPGTHILSSKTGQSEISSKYTQSHVSLKVSHDLKRNKAQHTHRLDTHKIHNCWICAVKLAFIFQNDAFLAMILAPRYFVCGFETGLDIFSAVTVLTKSHTIKR